uniref:Uncharacterized protein n=1 Tax=Clytia hemisphaerica TaxID=252671 RepID=A0A7M5XNL6_9CNID|eukprot:TCONS_00047344-protein
MIFSKPIDRVVNFCGAQIIACLLILAACSVHWADFYFDGHYYKIGLWKVCTVKADECNSFDMWLEEDEKLPSWLSQIRILICFATVSAVVGLLTSLMGIFYWKIKCVYTSLLHFISTGLLVGVCFIFYKNNHFGQYVKVKNLSSFYVAMITAALTFLLAVFGIMADFCSSC